MGGKCNHFASKGIIIERHMGMSGKHFHPTFRGVVSKFSYWVLHWYSIWIGRLPSEFFFISRTIGNPFVRLHTPASKYSLRKRILTNQYLLIIIPIHLHSPLKVAKYHILSNKQNENHLFRSPDYCKSAAKFGLITGIRALQQNSKIWDLPKSLSYDWFQKRVKVLNSSHSTDL